MKKFINKINSRINGLAIRAKCAIENKKAEMYVDNNQVPVDNYRVIVKHRNH